MNNNYKGHWAILNGNEIFCYQNERDTSQFRVMHSLAGTFSICLPPEKSGAGELFYPVKIMLPPNKCRILYFASAATQQNWVTKLNQAVGYTEISEYYNITATLGKGQFGLVKLATH